MRLALARRGVVDGVWRAEFGDAGLTAGCLYARYPARPPPGMWVRRVAPRAPLALAASVCRCAAHPQLPRAAPSAA
eukprot:COSAG04_NODE_2556_length_3936_cov_167.292937_7_plen_75_part_01